MIDGRVIRGVDASGSTFVKSLRRIKDPRLQAEILGALRELLFANLDAAPRRLHLHPLTSKPVTSMLDPKKKVHAWTIHVTANDAYKASFTLEDGVAYMRLCDEHDVIDRNP
jgi:hypothetical protein